MKKEKFTPFGKGFNPPFVEQPDYYKTKTYEEVFKAVREDIENNFYTWTHSAKYLNRLRDDPEYLTKMLKLLVPVTPDLFESDNPSARKLVAHFGKLVNTSLYGQNTKERKEAKEAINDIIDTKAPYAKCDKVRIQPFLSLNDTVTYIHQITRYLRKQYVKEYGCEPLNEKDIIKDTKTLEGLKKTDQRLVTLLKSGYTKMLIEKPKELTKKLIADFFGLTLKGFEQKLKEEKHYPNTVHLKA